LKLHGLPPLSHEKTVRVGFLPDRSLWRTGFTPPNVSWPTWQPPGPNYPPSPPHLSPRAALAGTRSSLDPVRRHQPELVLSAAPGSSTRRPTSQHPALIRHVATSRSHPPPRPFPAPAWPDPAMSVCSQLQLPPETGASSPNRSHLGILQRRWGAGYLPAAPFGNPRAAASMGARELARRAGAPHRARKRWGTTVARLGDRVEKNQSEYLAFLVLWWFGAAALVSEER
jgi:hypothetical protein